MKELAAILSEASGTEIKYEDPFIRDICRNVR